MVIRKIRNINSDSSEGHYYVSRLSVHILVRKEISDEFKKEEKTKTLNEFDPGKDRDINASFFVHELLNKPNWRLEFQVSNSKWDKETP